WQARAGRAARGAHSSPRPGAPSAAAGGTGQTWSSRRRRQPAACRADCEQTEYATATFPRVRPKSASFRSPRYLRAGRRTARPDAAVTAPVAPLVSVITPVYNGGDYLRECIESVRSQTYTNWRYTIVNNCSTDDSLAIALHYAKLDPRIRVLSNGSFLDIIQNHNH